MSAASGPDSGIALGSLAHSFELRGDAATPILDVTEDSRVVQPGSLFVAVEGGADDGHRYIRDAVARGAAAVAVSIERASDAPQDIPTILVPSARRAP